MAADRSVYLPDLGRCLSGDVLLLSWNDVLKTLMSHDCNPSTSRTSFFSDHAVKSLLSKPNPSFSDPSSQSKSAFEGKTAAISASRQYNVREIESDALWLSQHMKIDELEALRLTVLEWQYRSETRLQAGFSDAELASLRDGLGAEYAEGVGLIPGGPFGRSDTNFDSSEERQVRLLQLYFSEQVRLLQAASEILQHSVLPVSQSTPKQDEVWYPIMKNLENKSEEELLKVIGDALEALKKRLQTLNETRSWPVDEKYHESLTEDYATALLQEISIILDMLQLRIKYSEQRVYSETLLTWLQFMQSVEYFSPFQSAIPVQQKAINRLQCTTSCITVALLNPSYTFASLVQDNTLDSISLPPPGKRDWFIDKDNIEDVHYFLFAAAESCNVQASLAVLVWGLLLLEFRALATSAKENRESRQVQKGIDRSPYDPSGRRLSSGSMTSMQDTIYETIMSEVLAHNSVDDPVEYMLDCAIQGGKVFDQFARIGSLVTQENSILSSIQLELLQQWTLAVRPSLGYTPDLLSAQLTTLGTPPPSPPSASPAFNPVDNFVDDYTLLQEFLDVAASRFPYESLPFLRLCRSLTRCTAINTDGTSYIMFRLQQLYSFTQTAVDGFSSYDTYREDENANLVQLNCAVDMLDFQSNKLLTADSSEQYHNLIPTHAIGEVIRETMPAVVRWQHEYSGLVLLGKWLELHLQGILAEALSELETPDEVAAEIISLIAALLEMTYVNAKNKLGETAAQNLCSTIIDELGTALDGDRNIIACISDLMEHQIQSQSRSGYETLIACIDFFTAYSKIQPQYAWNVLLQSSILGAKGTRRNLPALIAGIEVPSKDFRLLESCSRLYEEVIDSLLTVSFNSEDQSQIYKDLQKGRRTAAQRFNGAALLAYSETMYAAYESMTAWLFSSKQQKNRITSSLSSAFSKLIHYAFGMGESISSVTSLSACFVPAATFAVTMLQQADATSTGTGPLMPLLVSFVLEQNPKDALPPPATSHISAVLSLAKVLIRYSHLSPEPSLGFSESLFNMMPAIVRLPFSGRALWSDCQSLLSSLLQGPSPSLLGHLGSSSCVSFLDYLYHASQAVVDPDLECQMWSLLSRLVTVDQQWFAIVLITGFPPGRKQNDPQTPKLQTRGKPILEVSLDTLTDIDRLDPKVPAGLLRFVGEAQQNWLSVTDSIASRSELFPRLIRWVSGKDSYNANGVDQAIHNTVAAGVTDLAVIHLHRLMAMKNEKVFTTFIPLLQWLATNAVDVAAYNNSLHINLKKNFAMKYRNLDVTVLKRSGLLEVSYGHDYFYDLGFADNFLSNDTHWKIARGQQTFYAELERANINFSVVGSELTLLRSLERLCIEHGKFFSKNRDVARIMAQISRHCLEANTQVAPSEALFDSLFQTRADLAMVLVRPLAAAGYRGSDYSALLSASWDAARFRNGSYETAIANEDLTYWRTILSVLLMSIQFRVERKVKQANVGNNQSLEKIDPYNATFCEIAAKVVGEGLRSVTMALQEQKQGHETPASESAIVGAKDVALLLNILQTILRLPTLSQFAIQLSDALISTGASRSALLLYSWSHMLLENGEPVYADLSARFLASISSLPRVAEEMAIEGVLNRLLTSRITQTLQNIPNGVFHLDKRPNGSLLYSIWAQGMLPLCLNLLHAISGGVAGEVSTFLNAFPHQLTRAGLALSANPAYTNEGSGTLTTRMVSELSTLSLISFILSTTRDAGASAGVDPTAIVPLVGFDEHKKALAEDVRDVIGLEYAKRKKRTVVEGGRERGLQRGGKADGDLLDQKIVRDLKGVVKCLVLEEDEIVGGEGNGEE